MESNTPESIDQQVIKIETPMQKSYDEIITLTGGEQSSHLEQYDAARKYLARIREEGTRLASVNRSSQEMKENSDYNFEKIRIPE